MVWKPARVCAILRMSLPKMDKIKVLLSIWQDAFQGNFPSYTKSTKDKVEVC